LSWLLGCLLFLCLRLLLLLLLLLGLFSGSCFGVVGNHAVFGEKLGEWRDGMGLAKSGLHLLDEAVELCCHGAGLFKDSALRFCHLSNYYKSFVGCY